MERRYTDAELREILGADLAADPLVERKIQDAYDEIRGRAGRGGMAAEEAAEGMPAGPVRSGGGQRRVLAPRRQSSCWHCSSVWQIRRWRGNFPWSAV